MAAALAGRLTGPMVVLLLLLSASLLLLMVGTVEKGEDADAQTTSFLASTGELGALPTDLLDKRPRLLGSESFFSLHEAMFRLAYLSLRTSLSSLAALVVAVDVVVAAEGLRA